MKADKILRLAFFGLWLTCLEMSCYSADSVVVFNEVHYNPATTSALEFIEFYNDNSVDVDISGWVLDGVDEFRFPSNTVVAGRSYVVVAKNPAVLAIETGFQNALGPFAGLLSNGGEALVLSNHDGQLMDAMEYNDKRPWPELADGLGNSLAKIEYGCASDDSVNWRPSLKRNGTPGSENFPGGYSSRRLYISEISAASSTNFWIEIHNGGESATNVAGFRIQLSTGAEYVIPGFWINMQAGDYRLLTHDMLGLSAATGDRVSFYDTAANILDTIVVGEHAHAHLINDPDGALLVPDEATPGSTNSFTFQTNVVINEIMYHHRPEYGINISDDDILSTSNLIAYSSLWRYNASGSDLGTNWAVDHHPVNGTDWFEGNGLLGFESTPQNVPEPIGTGNLPSGHITYYFETDFVVTGALDHTLIELRHIIDDGAVFYINGQEVSRFNMSSGEVLYQTFASPAVTDGAYSGIVTLPASAFVVGTNRFSVEVHQHSWTSSDMLCGLSLVSSVVTNQDALAIYEENDEEWIELYNKGSVEVDLGGWCLKDAVKYEFPVGMILPAGGYLVVARDALALQDKYPSAVVVGGFSGGLGNNHDRIELVDALGNQADEVLYYDGKPWPVYADGNGSSLELRDARADNSRPEAWADSENTEAEWLEYSFTATAEDPVYDPSDTKDFPELRLSLLSNGEMLLDDISVIEAPEGIARELIQNGTFDSDTAAWRILGTHLGSHRIDDNGNGVLKIVSTGPPSYMHNLLETTFKSGGSIVDVVPGRDYEISFRAKWLHGSPQFHVEFYYNRIARTIVLQQSDHHGTPGAVNSTAIPNIGPTEAAHEMAYLGDRVTVSVAPYRAQRRTK